MVLIFQWDPAGGNYEVIQELRDETYPYVLIARYAVYYPSTKDHIVYYGGIDFPNLSYADPNELAQMMIRGRYLLQLR